jgi:hypothetical protein
MPPKLFRDAELSLSPQQQESYRMAEDAGVLRLTELGTAVRIQHVFELLLRIALESNKLESKSILFLPTDDGKSNGDGRPGTGGI